MLLFGQTSVPNLVLLNQGQQGSCETMPHNREQLSIGDAQNTVGTLRGAAHNLWMVMVAKAVAE